MNGRQFVILVADDDPDVVQTLSSELRQDHHRVVTASDGDEAIRTALRELPDLIVVDLHMPGASGLEVTRALRAEVSTARTPIIMVTAHGDEALATEGFDAGVDDFVVKPFTTAHLRARVTTWLLRTTQPIRRRDPEA